jgi:hypothetical protein
MLKVPTAPALQQPASGQAFRLMELQGPEKAGVRFMVRVMEAKLTTPKVSPQHGWTFEWLTAAYARPNVETPDYKLRFRVYSQYRRSEGDVAPWIARMLLRLWDFNYQRLRRDHGSRSHLGIVDIYLCFGGKAGGEQRFDQDVEAGTSRAVNTIYIYDVRSYTQPLEMAREVAHEYGHATLPAIGPLTGAHEEWINGDLGERLYLYWLAEETRRGNLGPEDAMGATPAQLDEYVRKRVSPGVARVAANGPDRKAIKGGAKAAVEAFLDLAMYAAAVLPEGVLRRALDLLNGTEPRRLEPAILLAVEELGSWEPSLPTGWQGDGIWLPIGRKGRVVGGQVSRRSEQWAFVRTGPGSIRVEY